MKQRCKVVSLKNMSLFLLKIKEDFKMKNSIYKNYDELPLFLNAKTLAEVFGIAPSSAYELRLVKVEHNTVLLDAFSALLAFIFVRR